MTDDQKVDQPRFVHEGDMRRVRLGGSRAVGTDRWWARSSIVSFGFAVELDADLAVARAIDDRHDRDQALFDER